MNLIHRPSLAQVRLVKPLLRDIPDAARHCCVILPEGDDWHDAPDPAALQAVLARQRSPGLADKPVSVATPSGGVVTWVRIPAEGDAFGVQSRLRAALQPLLAEHPDTVLVAAYGPEAFRVRALEAAAYVVLLNTAPLPTLKSGAKPVVLRRLTLQGAPALPGLARVKALAEANSVARHLTMMPPNVLNAGRYRREVAALAAQQEWRMTTYGLDKLRKMGAGAFVAVAQGSAPAEAAIVKLVYDGRKTKKGAADIALVGKGICFDTGGHNLKPARYMQGMHEDMNGSAVALGIVFAATALKLPIRLTAWLAIAENHLSPQAYTQNAVVTALNGQTIEIVHTDAEGRMVLADTLTLAARDTPDAILDFATLTGSMHTALGTRYSGVFANREALLTDALAAGEATGERVCAFPLAADYAPALDSEVADVKQCTLEGEADHILAALFLQRFVADRPWLHMDLSASRCKDGLGAVTSEVTGFGVAWGLAMLERLAAA
ncbi:MAG: leucyl aminopeptidase family protein [Betaproteobacteria bacterium]|jgi:leucyl aminopeptidase|nr:MAG: leucyl aminopeptidase family protein [Betaproteobacteria bacterium]